MSALVDPGIFCSAFYTDVRLATSRVAPLRVSRMSLTESLSLVALRRPTYRQNSHPDRT
jgi:hypothetical protein